MLTQVNTVLFPQQATLSLGSTDELWALLPTSLALHYSP